MLPCFFSLAVGGIKQLRGARWNWQLKLRVCAGGWTGGVAVAAARSFVLAAADTDTLELTEENVEIVLDEVGPPPPFSTALHAPLSFFGAIGRN